MIQQEPCSPEAMKVLDPAVEAASGKTAGHTRRVFLFKISVFLNAAVGAVLAAPIFGYLLGPALKRSAADNSWVDVGDVDGFPEGETRLVNFRSPVTTEWDGQTGDIPCWVRRISALKFQVFAINCAHLGCPVRWFAQSKLFMCPCHGGAYYADGTRASGPPQRGLFEYEIKILGGRLLIDAGNMPTLATQAGVESPLTQIGGGPSSSLATMERPKPRCGSCQS